MEQTTDKVILARREYAKKWRMNNPQRVKRHKETFFLKQAARQEREQLEGGARDER